MRQRFSNSRRLNSYVPSYRQFPASAIYYKYHAGMKRNMPVTVRFC